jgi:molybdopterin molybdotransferase/putative molybdopterin biosynthesis protein
MNHDVMKASTKEQALQKLLSAWKCIRKTEYCSLEDCLGRVAAEDIFAINTIPTMRISAMDGFAVKSEAFAEGIPDVSKWVIDTDFTPADTGDDFPDEYDSVIAVEQLHFNDEGHLVLSDGFTFEKYSNIRPAGCIMQQGDLLVRKNVCITPELQANLAVGGIQSVPVISKPVVAFIPTGSELVEIGSTPQRGQNIECNSLLVSAYLKKWGADVVKIPIVRDNLKSLEEALDSALEYADIVILSGGSSKGTEDYTSRIMESKASYFEHTVRTVPGRPVGISIINEKPVINMPGPTMAAWVVNDWLIYPMICHYFGIPVKRRQTVQAVLTEDMRKGPPVEVYSKVCLKNCGGIYYATPLGRGASTSESLRDGNGLLIVPIGGNGFHKGQSVSVELLTDEALIEVVSEL